MLAPRHRSLLLESMRPPPGYRLGRAIATTYTLDLLALLTAPLAFTFFDWEDSEGRPSANPLALLEAVRRHARKLHVFCHGGAISVPRHGQVLLAHLEPCVVEVAAPRGGVFHPKVWVLRFEPDAGSAAAVRFRLLVGTRNLTFDRSWDTLLQLEGELLERGEGIARNRPLSAFVAALPGLALHGAPPEAVVAAGELAAQLLHVEWEHPDKVDDIEFLPLGIGDNHWPFDRGRQRLVMSPFLDADFLTRFAGARADGVIVSSPEALQGANAGLDAFAERFVLAEGTDGEEDLDVEEPSSDGDEGDRARLDVRSEDNLRGLHAKLFVLDDGHRAHVFTGSANGTSAAFERNVEFLVRLDASKRAMGIEALFGRGEKGALFELLAPWTPAEIEDDPEEDVRRRLEQTVEKARRSIAEADLWLALHAAGRGPARDSSVADGSDGHNGAVYGLELHGVRPVLPNGVHLTVWPVVLPPLTARALANEAPLARFDVSLGSATAFLAFELVTRSSGLEHKARFVRRLRIEGLPDDRDQQLLRLLLKDRETVLRLLYLLLSPGEVSTEALTTFAAGYGATWRTNDFGLPLFEPLVTALARGPEALVPVEHLVADLSRTDEGRALLPEGFEDLLDAVRAAREELAP